MIHIEIKERERARERIVTLICIHEKRARIGIHEKMTRIAWYTKIIT